jgi:hypothetical protein
MEPSKVASLQRKLKARGFKVEGVREHCADCNASTVMLYVISGRIGGRDIEWCGSCSKIRSFRRTASDERIEEPDFDLEKFLA